MMPVNLIVVRHGESIGNIAKRMSEEGDNSLIERLRGTHTAHWPLTKKGIGQAKKTGLFLNQLILNEKMYFDKMYVSSYARAMQTAGHLDLIRSNWLVDTRISERDWGVLDRMTEEERQQKFGEAIKMRTVEPFFWAPPGGEMFRELIIRVRDFIDSLYRADIQNAIVVCHGEVMKAFRIIFLQMTPMEYAEMEFSKESLKRIHNCQVDHYSRRSYTSLELSHRLEWLQIHRPSEQEGVVIPWHHISKKRFNSFELLREANKLSDSLGDLKL